MLDLETILFYEYMEETETTYNPRCINEKCPTGESVPPYNEIDKQKNNFPESGAPRR